jgi:hypothetical protein
MTEAGKVKAELVDQQTKRIVAINPSLLPVDVAYVISKTLETSVLPPCWPLHVWTGDAIVEVTVAEVLAQKSTYHEKRRLREASTLVHSCFSTKLSASSLNSFGYFFLVVI